MTGLQKLGVVLGGVLIGWVLLAVFVWAAYVAIGVLF